MERRKEGHGAPEGARGPSGSLTSPLRTMSPKRIFNEKSLSSIKPDSVETQKVVFVSHFSTEIHSHPRQNTSPLGPWAMESLCAIWGIDHVL